MNFARLPIAQPFRSPNFRFIYFSEIVFFLAAWMAAMVFGVIATHLKGNSPFYVGLVGFAFNLPMLFGPFIGVIIDRKSRPAIMRIFSLVPMVAAVVMAVFLAVQLEWFWFMFLLVLCCGVSTTFYYPAILTAVNDVIEDPNSSATGVGLVNSTNRIVMFFGYALAGWLIVRFNEQATFWVDALLFLLSFIFLLQVRYKIEVPKSDVSVKQDLLLGIKYTYNHFPALAIIIVLAAAGLLAWPYIFQMPVVNRYYLGGTPASLGMIMAVGGLGGTLAGFLMSMRKTTLHLTRLLYGSTIGLGLTMLMFGLIRDYYLGLILVFLLDFFLMMTLTVGTIFLQRIIDKSFQGRVLGLVSMVSFGFIPVGSALFYGTVGELFNVMVAFSIAGVLIMATGVWFWLKSREIRQLVVDRFVEQQIISGPDQLNKI